MTITSELQKIKERAAVLIRGNAWDPKLISTLIELDIPKLLKALELAIEQRQILLSIIYGSDFESQDITAERCDQEILAILNEK